MSDTQLISQIQSPRRDSGGGGGGGEGGGLEGRREEITERGTRERMARCRGINRKIMVQEGDEDEED